MYAYCSPDQFKLTKGEGSSVYRWNKKWSSPHFCSTCGCGTSSDSPAFDQGGHWDGKTRRIGVNARLIDDLDAANAAVTVIDGKSLW